LHRNRENLSPAVFAKLWSTRIDLGNPGITVLKTWIAKDLLRQVLALADTHPDRSRISHRLTKFCIWCAGAGAGVPELERLATTISTWWPSIEVFITNYQRQERGLQPRRQARRPQRLRLSNPRKPATTNTLRNHLPIPRMPQSRLTS
jgi:hypothetical protein